MSDLNLVCTCGPPYSNQSENNNLMAKGENFTHQGSSIPKDDLLLRNATTQKALKVINNRRSVYAIGIKKPEKIQGFNGIRTRALRDTGAMLYQLSYETIHWERGQL